MAISNTALQFPLPPAKVQAYADGNGRPPIREVAPAVTNGVSPGENGAPCKVALPGKPGRGVSTQYTMLDGLDLEPMPPLSLIERRWARNAMAVMVVLIFLMLFVMVSL